MDDNYNNFINVIDFEKKLWIFKVFFSGMIWIINSENEYNFFIKGLCIVNFYYRLYFNDFEWIFFELLIFKYRIKE